jgi:hypothetical protein
MVVKARKGEIVGISVGDCVICPLCRAAYEVEDWGPLYDDRLKLRRLNGEDGEDWCSHIGIVRKGRDWYEVRFESVRESLRRVRRRLARLKRQR